MWHEGCPGEDGEVQVSCSTIMGCLVALCGDLFIVSGLTVNTCSADQVMSHTLVSGRTGLWIIWSRPWRNC